MKRKIYLYGASSGGENYLKNNPDLKVTGFIDRSIGKQKEGFKGLTVYSLESVIQKGYDKIIITSIYVKEILADLEEQKIDMKKIEIPEKRFLTYKINPLSSKEMVGRVQKSLKIINKEFNNYGVSYYLMFGTLLGIIRDGDLIPWDDDVDIVLPQNQICDVKKTILEIFIEIKSFCDVVLEKGVNRISIRFIEDKEKVFSIDFCFYTIENGMFTYAFYVLPEKYFTEKDVVVYQGETYPIPKDSKKLLGEIYGENWKIPNQMFTYEDYL